MRLNRRLPVQFNGATPLQWSVRLADSEMARRGDSPGLEGWWRSEMGLHRRLFTLALLKLNESGPERALRCIRDKCEWFFHFNGWKNSRLQS